MAEYPLTARQKAIYDAMESIAETFGPFDQTSGPDGSHYVPESPFPGLVCANCAYYEGPRGCEIVAGDIAPEAVCKFWVIPETLITERSSALRQKRIALMAKPPA